MKLHIYTDRPIREVQEEFNQAFPFLKIEFYPFSPARRQGEIELSEEMTVYELEKQLQEEFNLHAQIWRQSGNIWLETTITEGWSLKEQNEHGREISSSR